MTPSHIQSPNECFHCGLPIPSGIDLTVAIDGRARSMCCRGCQAVAQAIVDGGHTDYYRLRTRSALNPEQSVPEFLDRLTAFDNPKVQQSFVSHAAGTCEASLILEGINCAACVWLNERHLRSLPGVIDAQINYSTHRARITWDPDRIQLSRILAAVRDIGYAAHPYDPQRGERLIEQERRAQIRRIGLAGLLGMQVMMIAVALYFGDWSGIENRFRALFAWVSLLLTIPVLIYSGQPFFAGAWRDLRHFRAGMDVPVVLGLTIAFAGSVAATWRGIGHVYYDSVVMFVFLLLVARYFELIARKRSTVLTDAIVRAVPAVATRLVVGSSGVTEETVVVSDLTRGDRILVRPGEPIPADGTVTAGHSSVDESMLTGESRPLTKTVGDPIIAGAINVEGPLEARVVHTGSDTVMSQILRLVERAHADRPRIAQLADRAAGWFVTAVLILAVVVAVYWWHTDATHWLPVTVSVLVVTCPCALSLATPVALTAASALLTRHGLVVTRSRATETLARVDHFVFDKTGTLTEGKLSLVDVRPFADVNSQRCLRIAAALERYSEHPIARSIRAQVNADAVPEATGVINIPGKGLTGSVAGKRYIVGTAQFTAELTGRSAPVSDVAEPADRGASVVFLADHRRTLAAFVFTDRLRAGAANALDALRAMGIKVSLYSGDRADAVIETAQTLGIDDYAAGLSPSDKVERVRRIQQSGGIVAMVGDGLNDAPVLSAAQVSIAMGNGTEVTKASADLLLLNGDLSRLAAGVRIARRTLTVVRQNIGWAVGYNLLALPAAVVGVVPPWLAALGMSLSSLIVVANALRIMREDDAPSPDPGHAMLTNAANA